MRELIFKAARELGIENKVHVLEDHQLNPLVSVIEGTHVVQGHIAAHWFMDSSLRHVKTILSDMVWRATIKPLTGAHGVRDAVFYSLQFTVVFPSWTSSS
jgi:hypothetical protein